MIVSSEETSKTAIAIIYGPLDFEASDTFKKEILELIESGHIYLILNFENTNFVCSTGLGVLVSALKRARKVGGDIRLCNLKKNLRSLLDLTKLSDVFEIFKSLDEAKKDFGD